MAQDKRSRLQPDNVADTTPSIQFVLLKRYCALTGDTAQAVHNRRSRGDWIDGRHCVLVDGRRLWINLVEVDQWVRNGGRSN